MAVAFDAVGPSSAGATSSGSAVLSWTHTCAADGVALVVGVVIGDSNDAGLTVTAKLDPSGANTTIPSLGAIIHSGAGTAGFIALFGLPNVATGAHTVTATVSAAVDNMEGGSTSFTGADLTTAFSAQQSFNSASTAAPSITFTGSTSGNMVTAVLGHGASISSVTAGTSRWIRNVNVNSRAGNGGQATIAGGGSVTITWAAGTDWEGIAAVEVLATSAPPVPDTSLYRPSWVMPRVRNLLRSPFLQAPARYWTAEPRVPVLTTFNAENGTDGVTVTQGNFPLTQAPTIGTGSIYRFEDVAASHDTLGYYVKAASGFQSTGRVALLGTGKVQRLRMSFKLVTPPTAKRNIWIWRHNTGFASRLLIDASNQICVQDFSANELVGPVLTVGTWYDFSELLTVGTGQADGFVQLKVYAKDTTTQVGSTVTSSTYNLGGNEISHVDTGVNDAVASDIEFYWEARIENDVSTEFDPLTPSIPTGFGVGATVAAGSATGARTSTGSASGTSTASGSAVGKRVPKADGSGASVLAGSAVGRRVPKATASGTSTLSGSAVGTRVSRGTASGASVVAGTAAGARVSSATASGTSVISGTATGAHASQGTASGASTATGNAAGTRTSNAAGTGTSTATGTATGTSAHSGTAAGSSTITGSASGVAPAVSASEGSGSGTSTIAGSATGTATHQGATTGTSTVSGTATGSRVSRATATGSSAITGSAAGDRNSQGLGSGASVITGSAIGFAPIIGGKSGSGAGSTVCTGTATGSRVSRGTASGSSVCAGTATGSKPQRGTSAGLTVGVGTAAGAMAPRGLCVGTSTITGTAVGLRINGGFGSGSTVCTGTAAGTSQAYRDITLTGVVGQRRWSGHAEPADQAGTVGEQDWTGSTGNGALTGGIGTRDWTGAIL